MNRFEALVSLNMVPGIGSVRLGRLLEFFGKPENIINAQIDKLTRIFGMGEKIAEQIHSFETKDLIRELDLARKSSIRIMTVDDASYPENLKEIPGPPIVLYIKGELLARDKFSIGIVGSRRASFYGLTNAERLAGDLSDKGLTVVSGMARGIDTSAHRGALKRRNRTIAVMGSGFNRIYPAENKKLAEEIAACGAVISEFPMDEEPQKQNFPRRNRVVSGLSLGVLVVEAARNSGALITADFALEQGREVFALPGKIDAGNSFGTNALIKQGAKLVSCADDIIEELNLTAVSLSAEHDSPRAAKPHLADEDSLLYGLIQDQPVVLDEIAEKANMDIPRISGILLRLQLKKLIRQLPGKQFIRSVNG